jgi:hypothetical protein
LECNQQSTLNCFQGWNKKGKKSVPGLCWCSLALRAILGDFPRRFRRFHSFFVFPSSFLENSWRQGLKPEHPRMSDLPTQPWNVINNQPSYMEHIRLILHIVFSPASTLVLLFPSLIFHLPKALLFLGEQLASRIEA